MTYPIVTDNEKIHDPELTDEATRLARLADKAASRDPWQEDAAAYSTEELLAESHPDLIDSRVPNDVLRAAQLGAQTTDDTHYPENTPHDDSAGDEPDVDEDAAAVVPDKPKAAKKPTQKAKAKK